MKIDVNIIPSFSDMSMEDQHSETEEITNIGVDFSSFTKEGGTTFIDDTPKRGRKKKTPTVAYNGEIIPEKSTEVTSTDNTYGYASGFSRTNSMLEGAIAQTDELGIEIKGDIDTIRASKTLKNKYNYITNLTGSAASLISAKIAAIKEIDGNISQAYKLELDRMKAMKLDQKDMNDEARMMDLYKAFVNTPVGSYSPTMPTIADMTMNPEANGIAAVSMGDIPQTQLTPEQMRMRMENNPNIITVLKFNQSTGQRFFDVIDRTNGESIPNYPRPDAFLLENTTIDIHSMSARNKNLDTIWPLVLIGDGDVSEY